MRGKNRVYDSPSYYYNPNLRLLQVQIFTDQCDSHASNLIQKCVCVSVLGCIPTTHLNQKVIERLKILKFMSNLVNQPRIPGRGSKSDTSVLLATRRKM